jgi:hypothetical protein
MFPDLAEAQAGRANKIGVSHAPEYFNNIEHRNQDSGYLIRSKAKVRSIYQNHRRQNKAINDRAN